MIDELEVQKYDAMFGTRSKVYQVSNNIIINTALDEWIVTVTDWGEREKELVDLKIKPHKKVLLLHKNKRGRKNKYHIQAIKNDLYDAFHSIYTHRKWMPILKASQNTYCKGNDICKK